MAPSRDTSNIDVLDHTIDFAYTHQEDDAAAATVNKRSCRSICRSVGCCVRVAPWVPAISTIMIAVGLPFWVVYTRRALSYTQLLTQTVTGQPAEEVELVQMLSAVVWWVSLVTIAAVSAVAGVSALLALARCYQKSARLPTTKCSAPGKLSYGSYVALSAPITFLVWLMTVAVGLLLAGFLVWLTVATLVETALDKGVIAAPASRTTPAQDYAAATRAINALSKTFPTVAKALPDDVAAQPAVAQMAASVDGFVAAAQKAPVVVCPSTCLNLGSFYAVLELQSSCLCNTNDLAFLRTTAHDLWTSLVHALSALALMCLANLWLLMSLSATFAHARRDLRALRSGSASGGANEGGANMAGDGVASVYLAPSAVTASKGGKKEQGTKRQIYNALYEPQDVDRTADSTRKAAARSTGGGSAASAAASTTAVAAEQQQPTARHERIASEADAYMFTYPPTELSEQPQALDALGNATTANPLASATPSRRTTQSSSGGQNEVAALVAAIERSDAAAIDGGSASAGHTGANGAGAAATAAYNRTAQRYAEYRLRAQQSEAKGARSPGERRQWVR